MVLCSAFFAVGLIINLIALGGGGRPVLRTVSKYITGLGLAACIAAWIAIGVSMLANDVEIVDLDQLPIAAANVTDTNKEIVSSGNATEQVATSGNATEEVVDNDNAAKAVAVSQEETATVAQTTANVIQDIGTIEYSIDGSDYKKAPELSGSDYGHRVWFSNATALFPNAPWDYVYTAADWKKIENTWIDLRVTVPANTVCRIWCYSWKQGDKTYDGGYLMELGAGHYEFSIKNGEAQNWPISDSFCAIDFDRILDQKRNGNVNVKKALAFAGVTQNVADNDRLPSDFTYEVVAGPIASTN